LLKQLLPMMLLLLNHRCAAWCCPGISRMLHTWNALRMLLLLMMTGQGDVQALPQHPLCA